MTDTAPASPSFKQKAAKELKEYIGVSFYLGFFFCSIVTYSILLLRKYDVGHDALNYTFAIINALVIGKVILIGKMAKLGRRTEGRPLYQSVLFKSVLFGVLVFLFHLLEEFVKRLIHGEPSGTVLHNINFEDLIGRSILVFCAFIPLFAFMELRRVLGEEKLHNLFFKSGATAIPGLPAGD
jgi:hypothetical protein